MERSLYLTKFRNFGYEKGEKLLLNNSLLKENLGNLIILVGPNNSGKSNVLDSLIAFNNKSFQERDVTTLSYDEGYDNCQLSLCCKDGEDEYTYRISKNDKLYVHYPDNEVKKVYTFSKNPDKLVEEVELLINYIELYVYEVRYEDFYIVFKENYRSLLSKDNDKTIIEKNLLEFFEKLKEYKSFARCFSDFLIKYGSNIKLLNEFENYFVNDPYLKLCEMYEQKYGYKFMPNIVNYEEKKITNNMLIVNSNRITDNSFFKVLFKRIGCSLDKITNAYAIYRKQQNKAVLRRLEDELNEKLKLISDDFNDLYFADDDKYSFKISLESELIFFMIFRSGIDVSLDYQSTGFHWFFNLYFNLLSDNSLEPGDILIMDEPATNLHVEGQKELRKFLKEFAIKNSLTIIIATHIPFLVDANYFDELRVVYSEKNNAHIINDFSTYNGDDPDSLKPIKNALTVHSNILINPEERLVYVEGITDYNYLIAMKKKLKIEYPITFLPINGVRNCRESDFKKKQIELSKFLIRNWKFSPSLLVDGDKPGLSMKKLNEKDSGLNVIALNDVNQNFKEIESLFSVNDLKKYGLLSKDGKIIKHASTSSVIKTFIEDYEFEKETLDNFKSLFEYLID